MGIAINIPINMRLEELLAQEVPEAQVDVAKKDQIIVKGGPVSPDEVLFYTHLKPVGKAVYNCVMSSWSRPQKIS